MKHNSITRKIAAAIVVWITTLATSQAHVLQALTPTASAQNTSIGTASNGDEARIAGLLRVARLAASHTQCRTVECAQQLGVIQSVSAAFTAGDDAAALFDRLSAAVVALDKVQQHDYATESSWTTGHAQGAAAFAKAKAPISITGPQPEYGLTRDQCLGICDRVAVITGAVCSAISLINPIAGAGCFLSLAASYTWCIRDCYTSPSPSAITAGVDAASSITGLPVGLTKQSIASSAARQLGLFYSQAEISLGIAGAETLLSAQ